MKIPEEDFQQSINYKKIVQRFLGFKRLYIVAAIIFLSIALIYNRTATVLFENSTTVMISEKERNALTTSQDFMSGMAFLTGQNNIDNEIEVLRSFSIIKEAVQRMDIKTSIYSYEKSFYSDLLESSNIVEKTEEYEKSPVRIVIDPTHDQAVYLPYYIEFIDENSFNIYTKSQKDPVFLFNYIDDDVTGVKPYKHFRYKYNFGQEIKTEYCSFQILKTEFYDRNFTRDKVLYFYMHNTNYLTFEYQAYLTVAPISQTASIINLSLRVQQVSIFAPPRNEGCLVHTRIQGGFQGIC